MKLNFKQIGFQESMTQMIHWLKEANKQPEDYLTKAVEGLERVLQEYENRYEKTKHQNGDT